MTDVAFPDPHIAALAGLYTGLGIGLILRAHPVAGTILLILAAVTLWLAWEFAHAPYEETIE